MFGLPLNPLDRTKISGSCAQFLVDCGLSRELVQNSGYLNYRDQFKIGLSDAGTIYASGYLKADLGKAISATLVRPKNYDRALLNVAYLGFEFREQRGSKATVVIFGTHLPEAVRSAFTGKLLNSLVGVSSVELGWIDGAGLTIMSLANGFERDRFGTGKRREALKVVVRGAWSLINWDRLPDFLPIRPERKSISWSTFPNNWCENKISRNDRYRVIDLFRGDRVFSPLRRSYKAPESYVLFNDALMKDIRAFDYANCSYRLYDFSSAPSGKLDFASGSAAGAA